VTYRRINSGQIEIRLNVQVYRVEVKLSPIGVIQSTSRNSFYLNFKFFE